MTLGFIIFSMMYFVTLSIGVRMWNDYVESQ